MFSHLLVRSEYSFYQSTIRLEEYVKYAHKIGYQKLVLADHNVLFGHHLFAKICQKEGIEAIFGMEVDVFYQQKIIPFLLIAKDNQGYKELIHDAYLIAQNNYLSLADLQAHTYHIHIIAYGEAGYLDEALLKKKHELLLQQLIQLKQDIPHFDIAISYNENTKFRECNTLLKRLCQQQKIKTVALAKVYYLRKEEAHNLFLLQALKTNKKLKDTSLTLLNGRYLYCLEEMKQFYEVDDLMRCSEILEQCHVNLADFKTSLPEPSFLKGKSARLYLTKLVQLGLQKRLGSKEIPFIYQKRIQKELAVIFSLHFENYFLIIYEAVYYAYEKNLLLGPGRGSAVGSLVAYAIGISQIDPLKYDLLFERFLNPERQNMPDIDIDIAGQDRALLLQHLKDVYGYEHIATISTFNTYASVEAVLSVAKVYELSEREERSLIYALKKARQKWKIDSLSILLSKDFGLQNAVKQSNACREVIKLAQKIEKMKWVDAIHPAGIVLSKDSLFDVVPVLSKNNFLKIQWDKNCLEEHGLIKMDFLSLKHLDNLKIMLNLIHREDPQFNLHKISLSDARAYQILNEGLTLGLFQFEAPFIKSKLSLLKPNNFLDLVNVLGIARPQAIHQLQRYIQNKMPSYPVNIQNIIKQSHGVFIFQEQVMRLLVEICGISFAKAETIRKYGKEKPELYLIYKEQIEKVHPDLWLVVKEFVQGFGFNLSHGLAYGLLAYRILYIKAHYTYIFYATLMNQAAKSATLMVAILREIHYLKIPLKAFNMIDSPLLVKANKHYIQLGLCLIPSLNDEDILLIQKDLQENGDYKNYFEAVARLVVLAFKPKQIEEMTKVGCFDYLGDNRKTYLNCLDDALTYANLSIIIKEGKKSLNLHLVSLPTLVKQKESIADKRKMEKEVLGFTLQMGACALLRQKYNLKDIYLKSWLSKPEIATIAEISTIHKHRDKNGNEMVFMQLTDDQTNADVIVFNKLYNKIEFNLVSGKVVRVWGRWTKRATIEVMRIEEVTNEKGFNS